MPSFDPHSEYRSRADQIIKRLQQSGRDWPCAPELQHIGDRTVDELLDIITHEEEKAAEHQFSVLFALMLSLLAWCVVIFRSVQMWSLAMLGTVICLSLNRDAVRSTDRRRYAVYALTQTHETRLLVLFIQATRFSWGRHPEILCAITRLLEQVTEAHSGLLSDAEQEQLWQLAVPMASSGLPLNESLVDEELALSTLRALACIGNKNTYLRLSRLARRPMGYTRLRYIIGAARDLAPLMDARLQRHEVPATLLRASTLPPPAPDNLLRPAQTTASEPPEQLLRAGATSDTAD